MVLNLIQYLRISWFKFEYQNDAKIGVECSIEFLAQPLDTSRGNIHMINWSSSSVQVFYVCSSSIMFRM